MTENGQLNNLEAYIPSSSEKKQAVLMYMVVGLLLSMGKWEVSPYTHHHIKQSLGWLVFLVFTIFVDLFLTILGLILSFFLWIAVLITIPVLTVGIMGIYQATKGKYIRESETSNRFFLLFSGIGNRVLNLFDSDHYQIIDANRYRSEDQFCANSNQKENKADQNSKSQNEIIDENINGKSLDNDQQISINNHDIGIDLSNHEINNPENVA